MNLQFLSRLTKSEKVYAWALSLLLFSLLLGGASRNHEIRLATLQILSLPLLGYAIFRALRDKAIYRHPLVLAAAGTLALIPALQIVPLPPYVWGALPGREELTVALSIAEIPPSWSTISLTPDRTWSSFLSLMPPFGMLLAVLTCPARLHARLVIVFLACVVSSVLLGSAQIASGGDRLYLWATTDAGNFSGFFANRNHLATYCLMALPFMAVFGARSFGRMGGSKASTWIATLALALVAVAIVAIRSRAGIILIVPVALLSLIAAWLAAGRGIPSTPFLASAFALLAGGIGALLLGLQPILARFDPANPREGRFENWPFVLDAANTYLPLGSGIGSFDSVFRSVEPLDRLDSTFFNQAHNDYLESWLETGWLGVAALTLFLVWYGRRTWSAWRSEPAQGRDIQRASSIAVAVVLAHSAVDYPLRTVAVAVAFALCVGILEFAKFSELARPTGKSTATSRPYRAPST